ncbi:MAG: FAS1-like dehydratase domain-containing protein [Acidimicrobiales bacterium]
MNALEAIVSAARAGSEEFWTIGPVTARDAARFAAASGDVAALGRLRRGSRVAPPLLLSGVLDWDIGSDVGELRGDGLSPREAPYVGDHDVRLVHGGQALRWYRPVLVGEDGLVARRSVRRADHRNGRSGELAIIGLETRYVVPRSGPVATCRETILCLPGDRDSHRDHRPPPEIVPGGPADVETVFTPAALARFSAVTWNAHRIHLDEQFAKSEGFDGLVVQSTLHGVTLLRAAEHASGTARRPAAMSWRNLAPAVAGERLHAAGRPDGTGGWDVVEWTADGVVTARGHVRFRSDQRTAHRDDDFVIRDTRRVGAHVGGGAG